MYGVTEGSYACIDRYYLVSTHLLNHLLNYKKSWNMRAAVFYNGMPL